ncbi:MAG: hypothetical protein AB7P03_09675 [Kofleriaceae bacterium]
MASSDPVSASDDEILSALGIAIDGNDHGEVRAECSRIARRIRASRLGAIGFVPSGDKVAVPPLIIQIGLALCDLSGATVAVVDANVRYPGLAVIGQGHSADAESVFTTRWLRGSLALLSAPRVERAGDVVPQLTRVLESGRELFAHILVDLTGFDLLGEHTNAASQMDAVAIVGRAHKTREAELLQLAQLMPRGRFLGVLLVG